MQKTILATGSTDGIGLETAKMLVSLGHHVLLHGPNPAKLEKVEKTLSALPHPNPMFCSHTLHLRGRKTL
jgi:short-subunit dehydrogenase involved in D-alanine esterification of teichoic acids